MLDRYLENLHVEVEPFAVCLVDEHWRLTLPGPPVNMLHFIVQGDGWLIAPGIPRQRIGPNSIAVIPVGAGHMLEAGGDIWDELKIECTPKGPPVHYIKAGNEGPLELVVGCGTLNVRYGDAFGLFDHLRRTLVVDLNDIPEVPVLFQGLLAEQAAGQPGGPVLQGAMMTQVLVYMLRKLVQEKDDTLPWLAALDDPRLAAVLDVIMDNPAASHSVESLAEVAHMSRSAFANAFKTAFATSPISLLNHIRLEQAASLLHSSKLSVDQVASKVGYSSRSHFSREFKKHMGIPPAEYRLA
ncbi:MAG: AraC family transcriptional regulator [Xanthomonadales bacterium]|nr:AraC family transcriptional regulator [Xanthomonadales bacterium]